MGAATVPAFSAAAERTAVTRPSITLGRKTYVGVILSIEQWWAHSDALLAAEAVQDSRAVVACWKRYLRAVFPWRLAFRWLGDPVPQILALPPVQLAEEMHRFFACQLAASPGRRPAPPPARRTSDSSG